MTSPIDTPANRTWLRYFIAGILAVGATIGVLNISSYIDFTEIATPAAPAAGKERVYDKTGVGMTIQNSAGVERTIGSGTVTGVTATSPITSSGGTTPVISTSVAQNKLIGRGSAAGTGVMQEIALGNGVELNGTTLRLTQMPTLTYKSNITGGTADPADNTFDDILDVEIGSTAGMMIYRSSGAPKWRSLSIGATGTVLVSAGTSPAWSQVDLTSTSAVTGILPPANGGTGVDGSSAANGGLLIGNGAGWTLATLTQGGGVTVTNGVGTITFGTAAITGDVTASANSFVTTIANLAVTNAKIANSTIDLTTKVTGTLPVSNGGTGVASLTAYAPIFGGTTSTGAVQSGTVGSSGQVLTSNGAGALPTFQAASSGTTVIKARLGTQFDKTNTTLASVTGLSVTLASSTNYSFHYVILMTCSAAGGAKLDMNGGTATITDFGCFGERTDGSAYGTVKSTALATTLVNGAAAFTVLIIDGSVTVNSGGTFVPQFAQNTASGTSSILINSYCWFIAN